MPASDSKPATKADLAVVKSELSAEIGVVKSDLAAVKSDLASVESKLSSNLAASTKRLALEIVNTNARIDRLETSLRDAMAGSTSRIMDSIDDFAKKSEARENAIVLHGQAITEIRVDIKNHDRRLSALEVQQP